MLRFQRVNWVHLVGHIKFFGSLRGFKIIINIIKMVNKTVVVIKQFQFLCRLR